MPDVTRSHSEESPRQTTPKSGGLLWLVIVLIIIVLGLIGIVVWLAVIKPKSSTTSSNNTSQPAQPTYSTPSTQESAETDVSQRFEDEARAVAQKFLDAYIARSFDQAKPYMIEPMITESDQVSFAGPSSPSRSRYEIVGVSSRSDGRIEFAVKIYYTLGGQPSGSENYVVGVIEVGPKFFVDVFNPAG